jgi:dipeptidase D
MSPLSELQPAGLWKHFEAVLKIPHGSGNEKALADHVAAHAKRLSLAFKKDKAGNIIVRKPASSGRESVAPTVLQGHLDMVCEKNSDVQHDFLKDPIQAAVSDGWVHAVGTTLGADNGIAVAACMAIMEDASLAHGPLEFLFTVDEETGLNGARGIEPGALKARRLLNLDSEEEGTFTIGCAGGADSEISIPLARKASRQKAAFRLKVSGLRGGHSGIDINAGRANALKLIARVLRQAGPGLPFDLLGIEGGNKHNAIPREAWADVLIAPAKVSAFRAGLEKALAGFRAEFGTVEKDLAVGLEDLPRPKIDPMASASRDGLIDFLLACPHGVQRMHPEIAGLVETSNNLAILRTSKTRAHIVCSSRSPVAAALEAVRLSLKSLARLAGAKIVQPAGYPGWAPNLNSEILGMLKDLHRKLYAKEAEIVAIHAGLECGIIGEKFPGMDMISFGPTIRHPHSPEEKVEIASTAHFWTFLTTALSSFA